MEIAGEQEEGNEVVYCVQNPSHSCFFRWLDTEWDQCKGHTSHDCSLLTYLFIYLFLLLLSAYLVSHFFYCY